MRVNSGTANEPPRPQTYAGRGPAVVRCSEAVYQNLPDSEADVIPECAPRRTSVDGVVFGSGRLSLRRAPFEGHRLQHFGKRALVIAQGCHRQSRAVGASAGARADQDPFALRWTEEVEADLGIDEGPFAHVDDLADAAGKIRRLHRLQQRRVALAFDH